MVSSRIERDRLRSFDTLFAYTVVLKGTTSQAAEKLAVWRTKCQGTTLVVPQGATKMSAGFSPCAILPSRRRLGPQPGKSCPFKTQSGHILKCGCPGAPACIHSFTRSLLHLGSGARSCSRRITALAYRSQRGEREPRAACWLRFRCGLARPGAAARSSCTR